LFLAKKFGLLGSNEYEEQTIKAFYSSIHYLRERSLMKMTWTFPDKRKEAFETWTTRNFPHWIELHEQHLKRNGGNGHFFGDKVPMRPTTVMITLCYSIAPCRKRRRMWFR